MAVSIGVPRETATGETRIALVPAVAEKYAALGAEVLVQRGAGQLSHLRDEEFTAATLVDDASEVFAADVVLKVDPPTPAEAAQMRAGHGRPRPAAALQGGRRDQGAPRRQDHQLRARAAAAHHAGAVHGRADQPGLHRRLQGRADVGVHGRPVLPDADDAGRDAPAGQGAGARRRRGRAAGDRHRPASWSRRRGLRRALRDAASRCSRWAAASSTPASTRRRRAATPASSPTRRRPRPRRSSTATSWRPTP